MWRSIASNALTLFIVILVAIAGAVGWGQAQYSSAGPLETAICVRVAPGSNFTTVSENLVEQGAVSNGRILRIGADYTDRTQLLKAGSFLVPERASMQDIVGIITGGGQSTCGTEVVYRVGVNRIGVQVRELDPASNRFVETVSFNPAEEEPPAEYVSLKAESDTRFRVALAEGVTSWQIVQGLKGIDVMTGDVTEIPAEGRLAPDSYEVSIGDDRAQLLNVMQSRQSARLEEAWRNRASDLPYESPEEALVMASIVEKETGNSDEAGLVASVFVNRLNKGQRLQTDPTVIYGITKGEGVLGRGLRQSELRRETPYNTYVIKGLPPTPIANPGIKSLEAALNPPDTDYFFFVAKTLSPSDGHNFSVNYEQHKAFVEAYRKLEAARE